MLSHRFFATGTIVAIVSCLLSVQAVADPRDLLDSTRSAFFQLAKRVPSFVISQGDASIYDDAACLANPLQQTCFGPNADTDYFYPRFDDGFIDPTDPETAIRFGQSWKWQAKNALVILTVLPPEADYFGFTPYLKSRAFEGEAQRSTLAASVGDTLNHLNIRFFDELGTGESFNQFAALVLSPDMVTSTRVTNLLVAAGVPAEAINTVPYPDLPLQLGQTEEADLFTIFLRVSGPDDERTMDIYRQRRPIFSFFLTDTSPRPPMLFPNTGYSPRGAGFSEPAGLKDRIVEVMGLVQDHYGEEFRYRELDDLLYRWDKIGQECVVINDVCAFDNPDSIYTKRIRRYRPANDRDTVFVVAVNHERTNKAVYVNHNVANPDKQVSLASVNLRDFEGSLAYHTGLDADDPQLAPYQDLYVYAFAYDCQNRAYCLEIETSDTSDDPKAINRELGFDIATRLQLDPVTLTGPAEDEVVLHRLLIGCYFDSSPDRTHRQCLRQPIP